jgi:hypothetical protein
MLALRQRAPLMVVRGQTQTLTADVRDEADTVQTVTSGTLTITDGVEVVVNAATITGGNGATYSLADSVTTSRTLSDRWVAQWSLVIGGTTYTLIQSAYLVRWAFTPSLTPTDLVTEYSDIDDIRSPDLTSWSAKVTDARETIERELIKRGRRPHLILDPWALFDAHRHLVLHLIFKDAKSSIGDGRYSELAADHLALYIREIDGIKPRYDVDQLGAVTDATQRASSSPVMLTAGPSRQRSRGTGRRAY